MSGVISLAHGAGGLETRELIERVFTRVLGNDYLAESEDAAIIPVGAYAVSIDGFTVDPIIFNGGNIGKLAVAGSCNDVAMRGAKPKFLAASFIIEEGLSFDVLEEIVASFGAELRVNNALLIAADTKVTPRNQGVSGIFISTTAFGEVILEGLAAKNLRVGDLIIASGSIGDHGAAIFAAREGIELESGLQSDCASLWSLVSLLIDAKLPIVCMRDATRGGLAAVTNEWAIAANATLTLNESSIAVKNEVKGACELLGFEPYALANEGAAIVAVRGEEAAKKAIEIMRSSELGKNAAIIGYVGGERRGRVILQTPHKTSRFLDMPSGELLPRIC
ncbi:MAG: hydrogenase expression/formation protein HypE [Helicobacteraceae bacterium]|jgi:hydrogenase expression/formation protein HypE|nr:hydrogenase expression/formation protein HypE [Helicobacteraceae bacterium]